MGNSSKNGSRKKKEKKLSKKKQLSTPEAAEPFTVMLIGPGGVGKSALAVQFMFGEFETEYTPTKLSSFSKKVAYNDQEVQIKILDTPGQEEYEEYRNYFRSGDAFICVFSLEEPESFVAISSFREHVHRICESAIKIPFILVGNKADSINKRRVTFEEAQNTAALWSVPYVETSAKTGEHVEDIFNAALQMIGEKRRIEAELNGGANAGKKQKNDGNNCSIQ